MSPVPEIVLGSPGCGKTTALIGEVERELAVKLSVDEPLVKQDLLALPLREAREIFERDYLLDLLRRNGYNLSKAAREAGIDRKHIRNLLKKYGIPSKDTD